MELYIPNKRLNRDPTTGRFNKGSIPHNKGKKASEYMSKEGLEKILSEAIQQAQEIAVQF